MATIDVEKILALVPGLLKVPRSRMWVAYDKDADVLYINFKKPSHADNSELTTPWRESPRLQSWG
jgi:hypothetical protein